MQLRQAPVAGTVGPGTGSERAEHSRSGKGPRATRYESIHRGLLWFFGAGPGGISATRASDDGYITYLL